MSGLRVLDCELQHDLKDLDVILIDSYDDIEILKQDSDFKEKDWQMSYENNKMIYKILSKSSGELIGSFILEVPSMESVYLHLRWLEVKEKYRNKGIARVILAISYQLSEKYYKSKIDNIMNDEIMIMTIGYVDYKCHSYLGEKLGIPIINNSMVTHLIDNVMGNMMIDKYLSSEVFL